MKKLLMIGVCLLATSLAQAETISGKITNIKKNTVIVKAEDGKKTTLNTTDNTSYRKKKVSRKGKTHAANTYYKPMMEEDDWVEITYTPAKNETQSAEIQEVVIYDD